ncbi:MAG: hypothetical protein NDJ92_10510 [Thermoanaerobaculia bacterium]|nr:hypothetical protein [Thermoanaerobaculia bacterium]
MEIIYRSPWYYVAGALLFALILAYWGWRDVRRRGFSATVGIIWLLALMVTAIKLPSYVLDEIRVDHERMRWHEGPWWARADGTIQFADVRSVRVEQRTRGSRRFQTTETVWILESRSGTTDTYVVFGLWMEHYQDIKAHFVAKGIVVKDGA